MIDAWWLLIELGVLLPVCMYLNSINYKMGIWDGAFNQFLPHVQKEMMKYDKQRATDILGNK